ncbi:transmembrane protein 265 [Mixophyes fleayi]|uniref:transmembrane protein 265 n=1 Tax=Mixophyes fleayi TaxID=3061075 RepID=UPI003F4D7846
MSETQEGQELTTTGAHGLQNGSAEEIKVLIDKHDPTQQTAGFNQQIPSKSQARKKHSLHVPTCTRRRLAIMSIVCGFSCIGIKALMLALQAEQESDQQKKDLLSKRSRKFSIVSILMFVGALVLLPLLVVFISYILTFIE